ncbi:ATP-dependent RecD-like DNA helicase [Pseudoflavonifractor phocaeensis]|uniref:SF1B family DNA helicase RecD2 n=1 Tax=Pseudoflavonifractor phocaeensis TaxID=1870988 RepID=UPI001959A51D|nr:ATP-dependent RecD-like DNA helicase [Pseudoflavonifractor phocaeensis]MBM6937530.1 ATP-dependent RecD-like DNA helicase [Pseudoflavonifractor phocaeensis]
MEQGEGQNRIEGTVEAVIYQNEENGYTVLRVDAGEGGLTVVGCMPGIAPGEEIAVTGQWMRHASYGEQFKAEVVERRMPAGEKAVYEYLASGAVKGIGAATARRMVEEFGADALHVLEEEPERLTRIRGITRKKALAMGEAFRLQMGMRRLLEFLGENGVELKLAIPLYRRYGDRALETLRENPYLLVDPEFGVDFSTADTLALAAGLDGEDPQRIEAGLLFELQHNLNNGHTFLPRRKLLPATAQLLGVEPERLSDGLDALTERGEVVEERVAGEDACYLAELQEAETYVADVLGEMSRRELLPPDGLDDIIEGIQNAQGIVYAPQQREAVALAARRQVMLLTGGPGTGKTTSLRGVLALFDVLGLETALAAPTGRAAKRLGELCGVEGATIHRLLETQFDPHTGRLVFAHDEQDPLKVDAVIVDETSMVDVPLMRALLSALRLDCRLVLVGDPDQLPSVGPGSLFADLIRSGVLPMVRLTEIFRQAAQSAIVRNAHSVNRGICPPLDNTSSDFFFLRRRDSVRTAETIVELVERRLPRNLGIPPDQIQVLSPTRRGTAGTAALNRALQAAVNPPSADRAERRFGEYIFREGDRVMQVRNNYDVMWQEKDGSAVGMGIFNGDIGRITSIDNRNEVITVDFDGRLVEYSPDMLLELEPAYAITVHKSQGSEYRAVILSVCDGPPMLLTRGVLYTAITRARELLILVGEDQVVARMTANDRQQRRYSGLRWRLGQEF